MIKELIEKKKNKKESEKLKQGEKYENKEIFILIMIKFKNYYC